MKSRHKLAHILSHWHNVVAFFFSPVDSSDPCEIQQADLCSLDISDGILGGLKLFFWLAVSILIAVLLSNL